MDKPRRLHPVAVLTLLVKNVYGLIQLLLPIGIVLLAKGDIVTWLTLLIPAVILVFCAYTLLGWWRLVYYVKDNELYLESGVFTIKKRSIPFERIQGVQISEGLIQRLFGLVSLEVQTAGNDAKAEFSLSALTRQDAEELKALISSGHVRETAEPEACRIVEKLTTKALLQAATTSNGIGVIFFAIVALFTQFDQFIPGVDVYLMIGKFLADQIRSGMLSIALIIGAMLVLSWLLSILGSIITLGGFTLTRLEDRIIIEKGILSRSQVTLPIKKIQAIVISEGLLRQPFGLAAVEVVCAGYGNKATEAKVIFPIVKKSQVKQFLDRALPEFSTVPEVSRLPARALPGYMVSGMVMAALLCAVIVFVPWAYLLLLPAALIIILSVFHYLDAGYTLGGDLLIVRSRLLGRKTYLVPIRKVQWMDLGVNPLQARARLASLRFALMSQIAGTTITLKGMDVQEANDVQSLFKSKVGS